MEELCTKTSQAAENFLRSLAEQLAHQMGGKVEEFRYFQETEEKAQE